MSSGELRHSDVIAALLGGFAIGIVLVTLWLIGRREPDAPPQPDREPAAAVITDTIDTTEALTPRRDGSLGRLERSIADRLAADVVRIAPLQGALRIRARDVRWLEPGGRQWASAPAVSGSLDANAFRGGAVILRDVVLERANVLLTQTSDDVPWNYERVFEQILGSDAAASGPSRRFEIHGLRVVDTRVDVRLPDRTMVFEDVDATAPRVRLAGPGLSDPDLQIARLTTTLVLTDDEGDTRIALRGDDAELRIIDNGVSFDIARATIEDTQLAELNGVWANDLPGYGVRATGRALDVRFADIRFLAPERIPENGTASFRFAVDPVDAERTAIALSDLDASSGDSRVTGAIDAVLRTGGFAVRSADLRVDPVSLALIEQLAGRELPYGGTVSGTISGSGGDIRFDLDTRLTSDPATPALVTNLTGSVLFGDAGFTLRTLVATLDNAPLAALRAVVPGIPFGGTVSGRIALEGMPGDAPLNLDVRLALEQGVFNVQGVVDLTSSLPAYDLEGTILGVNLQTVLTAFAPPALLTGRFTLDGTGFDPATANARVSLGGRFTGWETGANDVVRARAVVAGGAVRVDTLTMQLATMTFAGAGRWRFVSPQEGAITYDLAISSLRPWGPYLPMADSVAAGSIAARGTVSGPLDAIRIAGMMNGAALELGTGWEARTLEAEYDVTVGPAVPRVQLVATARELGTPTAGVFHEVTADMDLTPPTFALELSGLRQSDQPEAVELVATGTVPYEGLRSIVVERAHLDVADGLWRLSRPATIAWGGGDGVHVSDFEFRNEERRGLVAINGRVLPLERADITLDIEDVPAGDLQQLLGRDPILTGDVWASGSIRDLGTAPSVDITFRLDSGAVMDVALSRFEGDIEFRNGALVTTAEAVFDTAGVINIELALPMRLDVGDSLDIGMGETGSVRGRIVADRVLLTPFQPLFRGVFDLQGYISGAVAIGGTVDDPQLEGSAQIVQGAATFTPLNKRYTEIQGQLTLAGNRIVIDSLSARSDGTAVVTGDITLESLSEPVLDLAVTLNDFEVMGVDNETDAEFRGTLALTGPLDGLLLSGNVGVTDGAVQVPQVTQSTLDESLFLAPGETFDDPLAPPSNSLLGNLTIRNLRVEVYPDTWVVVHNQARAQLGGTLFVNKQGDVWRIFGELEGERGTYTLAAGPVLRQFEISYARLRFLGDEELNPTLEITATRTIIDQSGRPVEIDVNIGGTMREPSLGLAAGNAANVPESELLSFLFFGQPSFALGGGGLASSALLGGVAEFLSLGIGESFAEAGLPFDLFQLRLAGIGVAGDPTASLVVGREIVDDVFLTVESYLSALFGGSSTGRDAWAIRLEWAFDRRSSLSTGVEPVNSALLLRGAGFDPAIAPGQQLFVSLRRRWLY